MTKKNNIAKKVLSLMLVALMGASALSPTLSVQAADSTVYIGSAKDLTELAHNCSLDTWSKNKTVVLTNDISLKDSDFVSIPSFAGTFDGKDYKISGLNITEALSPAGLFGTLESTATVKNLNLAGCISPKDTKENAGGIAGTNSGKIINCTFYGIVNGKTDTGGIVGTNEETGEIYDSLSEGTVTGESHTGGVAGSNLGTLSGCTNKSKVNSVSVDPGIVLSSLSIDRTTSIADLTKLSIFEDLNIVSDTGGIVGYSTGMVLSCSNNGDIGYKHVGYNVGGIAGRSCGYIAECTNDGSVVGRKDVAGIAGQAEPYISLNLSKDNLEKITSQLDKLSSLVDNTLSDADSSSTDIKAALSDTNNYLDSAADSAKNLTSQVGSYANGTLQQISRAGSITSDSIGQLKTIADDASSLSDTVSQGLSQLSDTVKKIKDLSGIGKDILEDLRGASDDFANALTNSQTAVQKLSKGINSLSSAVKINDKAAAKQALQDIDSGISDLISSVNHMSTGINTVITDLQNAEWTNEITAELKTVSGELVNISSALSDIHTAIGTISSNIDVDWEKISSGSTQVLQALSAFADACGSISQSLSDAQSGIAKITQGITALKDSVKTADQTATDAALKQIAQGVKELAASVSSFQSAYKDLSDTINNIHGIGDLISQMSTILSDIDKMYSSQKNMISAFNKVSSSVNTLLQNVTVDTSQAGDGAALVAAGFEDLYKSTQSLSAAADSAKEGITLVAQGAAQMRSGIIIKDINAIRTAIGQIYDGTGKINGSFKTISTTMGNIADTVQKMKIWGDNTAQDCRTIADAFAKMSQGADKVQNGLKTLKADITVDGDNAQSGLDDIVSGLQDVFSAAGNVQSAAAGISAAFKDIETASPQLKELFSSLADTTNTFATASDTLKTTFNDISSLFSYLNSADKIQLTQPSSQIKSQADNLISSVAGIGDKLESLSSQAQGASGTLEKDINDLTAQFKSLVSSVKDAVSDLQNTSVDKLVSDVSEDDINSATVGKVYKSRNNGYVYADLNAGGVAGSLAIDNALDPESDFTGDSLSLNKVYETKAILQSCTNYGDIVTKNDCAGSIGGSLDIGIATGCWAYGSAKSESGNYIGGIAGISSAKIKDCWSKCSLSGNDYIGGIVGAGKENVLTNSNTTVINCRSLVEITDSNQFAGAISGCNIGTYSGNLFVSDTLCGIDRLSYDGKAAPCTYEELLKQKDVPGSFKSFTLTFKADDKVIESKTFQYGESFDSLAFPEIPQKDGCYGVWSRTNLSHLKFDTVVSVRYSQYITSLQSDNHREDGRAIFFAEGDFDNKAVLDVTAVTDVDQQFKNDKKAEQWQINIPNDGQDSHQLHYLTANGKTDNYSVYVKADNQWKQVSYDTFGSYLKIDVDTNVTEIVVTPNAIPVWLWILISVIIILALGAVFSLIIKSRSKRKKAALSYDYNDPKEKKIKEVKAEHKEQTETTKQ